MKKRLLALLLATTTLFVGCGNAKKDENANLYDNDFRGSVLREINVLTDATNLLGEIEEKNSSIKDEHPSDFWSSSEFAYLSTALVDDSMLSNLYQINETDDWTQVESTVSSAYADAIENGEMENFSLIRDGANEYTLSYDNYEEYEWLSSDGAPIHHEIKITYDANHDWTQVAEYITYNDSTILTHLFEYGRYKNTYIIQTDKERLVATYKDVYEENEEESVQEDGSSVTTTTAVLVGKQIEKLYFASLDGENFKRNVFSYDDTDDMNVYTYGFESGAVTRDFELANQYGLTDSIFPRISEIGKDFVTEEGDYSRLLVYEDGKLTAKVKNTLAGQIESFVFDKNGKCTRSLEEIEDTSIKVYYVEYEDVDEYGDPITKGRYELEDGTVLETLGSGDNLILKYNDTYYNVVEREYNADASLNSVVIDIADSDTVERILAEEEAKKESALSSLEDASMSTEQSTEQSEDENGITD